MTDTLQTPSLINQLMTAGFPPDQAQALLSIFGNCSAPQEFRAPVTFNSPANPDASTDGYAININEGSTFYTQPSGANQQGGGDSGQTNPGRILADGDSFFNGDTTFNGPVTFNPGSGVTLNDHKLKNTTADTTAGFLTSKLTASGFISRTTVAAGGNESSNLAINTSGVPGSGNYLTYVNGTTVGFTLQGQVLNDNGDSTPDNLFNKLLEGPTTSITIVVGVGALRFTEIGINWKTIPGSGDNGKIVTYVATGDKLSVDTQLTFTNNSLILGGGSSYTEIKHNNPSQAALGLHSSKCGTGTVVYDLTGHLAGAYDSLGSWFSGFGIADPGLSGTNS